VGPIVPIAEKAIESENAAALEEALVAAVREQGAERFLHLGHLRAGAHRDVDSARSYVQAMLGLQVWAHGLYHATRATGHASSHTHD
jgi:hypothetical protein